MLNYYSLKVFKILLKYLPTLFLKYSEYFSNIIENHLK